jgi:hypothetical protein
VTDLTAEQTAELVPLARSIADTIRTTRVAWGDVDGLASAIAVAVAVYMGPLVGPVPAEMTALREQVEQARRVAVALEQENAEALRLLETGRPDKAHALLAGEL